MGDILSGVAGGGGSVKQSNRPDALGQAMNQLKFEQLAHLLRSGFGTPSQFAMERPDIYTPGEKMSQLWGYAMPRGNTTADARGTWGDGGMMAFAEGGSEGGTTATVPQDLWANASADDLFSFGAYKDLGFGKGDATYGTARGNVAGAISGAEGRNKAVYDAVMAAAGASGQRALGVNEAAFGRAYQHVMDQTSGYINQIASPQIMQAMALQGLEGGGAVPAAIARATAEYGGQMLSPILGAYQQGATGIAGQQQGTEGALGQGYMGSMADLGQSALEAESALGQGYMGNIMSFLSTLPEAYTSMSMLPEQLNAARASTAMTLFPMADYERSLREEDYLRRQGVAITGLTGVPFAPGSSSTQRQAQQPLWNWFGQG